MKFEELMFPKSMNVMKNECCLDAGLQAKTGFIKAVVMIRENYQVKSGGNCAFPGAGCPKPARNFESGIIAVIDAGGKEIPYDQLGEDVRCVLDQVRKKIGLCYDHLFEAHEKGII